LRIVVLTSCTGEKSVESDDGLTLEDFKKGSAHVQAREQNLKDLSRPAEDLYSGQQHVRLMRGVTELRQRNHAGLSLELYILSAGYGLVAAGRPLAPYEATFKGMGKADLRAWADQLQVPRDFRTLLAGRYDLALVLLGDDYLNACALDDSVALGGPTLLFCGKHAQRHLPKLGNLHTVSIGNADAKRFSCGLVALKGELGRRILSRTAAEPGFLSTLPASTNILSLFQADAGSSPAKPSRARAKGDVDYVITLPKGWKDKPHRQKLSYFIPEWDDLVDRDYDFENDVHSGGVGDWSNEVYAHQLYPEPSYDGILVSKVVAEKSRKKKDRINRLGVHRFLRVPRAFPVMGDCGAFGYINEKTPPYGTDEILDYYTRLDFDFGVSVDHLIVAATESVKRERYQLTIENAADFLARHRRARLQWTPIGAVQGWDDASYASAAKKYVAMGYRYIALGGLVRSTTADILRILAAVHEVVPPSVGLHLFGLARLPAMAQFARLGVTSVDSASYLRRAWMGSGGQNYLAPDGQFYTAIRIPQPGRSFRAKRMVSEERATASKVGRLEERALKSLRDFDAGRARVEDVLDAVDEYDRLITPNRPPHRDRLRRTLEARPWKACSCAICQRDGVDVIVFRGNNRNRRRGFHNTAIFYGLLQRILVGERVAVGASAPDEQLGLFESGDEV